LSSHHSYQVSSKSDLTRRRRNYLNISLCDNMTDASRQLTLVNPSPSADLSSQHRASYTNTYTANLPWTKSAVLSPDCLIPVTEPARTLAQLVCMHPAPLHRSNRSPTHSDLVCRLHNAWLYSVNATHWDTAISQSSSNFRQRLRGMLMNLSAYRSHQSISRPAAVARKNMQLIVRKIQ